MSDWIEFEEGKYAISRAYLTNDAQKGVMLLEPVLEIYTGRFGKRQMKGFGLVQNLALVELHEDGDRIDLLLDLGSSFRFRMENPILQGGKVFAPNVRSQVHFYPRQPWQALTPAAFDTQVGRLHLLSA
jgi:hypothetical protein